MELSTVKNNNIQTYEFESRQINQNKKITMINTLENCNWIEIGLNALNHFFIVLISIYMTLLCIRMDWSTKRLNRTLHVLLTTIGYQLLMCQGILTLYNTNVWSYNLSRQAKLNLHWILQTIGTLLAIVGTLLETINRRSHNKSHFISIHSKLGLISIILTVVSLLNGTSALWAKELKHYIKPVYNRLFHNLIGTAAFVIGMISLIYGYDRKTAKQMTTTDIVIVLQVLTGLTIILSLLGSFKMCYSMLQAIFPGLSN